MKMKKALTVSSLLIILVISSCSKFKGDKKGDLVYYCEDYKEADMNILDVHTSDIDALWIEMTPEKDGKDKCDSEFRETMFENAPKRNKDFLVAEKKSW